MTKFLDPKFSSRPASQEYRENFDRTFAKPDIDAAAPEGQVWVCAVDGRTSPTRTGFSDSSCFSHAVLCFKEKKDGVWQAVDQVPEPEPEPEVNVVESTSVVQFNKPAHDACCNCRLCRTAKRAEGK